jgi:hypothetical protein
MGNPEQRAKATVDGTTMPSRIPAQEKQRRRLKPALQAEARATLIRECFGRLLGVRDHQFCEQAAAVEGLLSAQADDFGVVVALA